MIADERPDLAEQVRAGTINDVECPHCKHSQTVESSLLYVDRKNARGVFVEGWVSGTDEFLEVLSSYVQTAFADLTRPEWEEFVATRLQSVTHLEEVNEALARDPSVDAAERMRRRKEDDEPPLSSELNGLRPKQRLERLIDLLIAGEKISAATVDASDEFYSLVQSELEKAVRDGNGERADVLRAITGPMGRYRDDRRATFLVNEHIKGKRPRLLPSDADDSFAKLIDAKLQRARSEQQQDLIDAISRLAVRLQELRDIPPSSSDSPFDMSSSPVSVKLLCPLCGTQFSLECRVLIALNNPSVVRREVVMQFADEKNCPQCARRCNIDVPVLYLTQSPMRGAFFLSVESSRAEARRTLQELIEAMFPEVHWQERMLFLQAILVAPNTDQLIRLATCSEEEFETERVLSAVVFRRLLDAMTPAEKINAMLQGFLTGDTVAMTDDDATDEIHDALRAELNAATVADDGPRSEAARQLLSSVERMRGDRSPRRGFRGTAEQAQQRSIEAYEAIRGFPPAGRLAQIVHAIQNGTPIMLHVDDATDESFFSMATAELRAAVSEGNSDRAEALKQIVDSYAMLRRESEQQPLSKLMRQLGNGNITLDAAIAALHERHVRDRLDEPSLEGCYRQIRWGSFNLATMQPDIVSNTTRMQLARLGYEASKLVSSPRIQHLFAATYGEILLRANPELAIQVWQHASQCAILEGDVAGQVTALGNIGTAYRNLHQYDRAIEFFQCALDLAKTLSERSLDAALLMGLAEVHRDRSDLRHARSLLKHALQLEVGAKNEEGRAIVLASIGSVEHAAGELREAMDVYEAAIAIFRALGNKDHERIALNGLGTVQVDRGDFKSGFECFNRCLELAAETQDLDGEAATLNNLGDTHERLGDRTRSLQCYQRALACRVRAADNVGIGQSHMRIGASCLTSGETTKATEAFEAAQKIFVSIGNRSQEAEAWRNMAAVYEELGETRSAIADLERARQLFADNNEREREASVLTDLGGVYTRASEIGAAMIHYKQALEIYLSTSNRAGEGKVLSEMATACMADIDRSPQRGNDPAPAHTPTEALDYARRAAQIHKELHRRPLYRHDLAKIGLLHEAAGQLYEARDSYRLAYSIFEWQRDLLYQGPHKEHLRSNSIDIWSRGVGVTLQLAEKDAGNIKHGQEGFEYAEAGKSRVLLDIIGHHGGELAAASEEEQARLRKFFEIAVRSEQEPPDEESSSVTPLSAASRAAADTLERMTDEDSAAFFSVKPLDVVAAQAALPPKTALLEYAIVPYLDTIGLFALDSSEGLLANPYRISLNEFMDQRNSLYQRLAALESELARSLQEVVDNASEPFQSYWNVLNAHRQPLAESLLGLGSVLFPPGLLTRLRSQGTERLLIVPDGPLYDIPFLALQLSIEHRQCSVVDDFEVVMSPSMSAFDRCRRKMRSRLGSVTPANVRTLMLSDPNHNRPSLALGAMSGDLERMRQSIFQTDRTVHLRQSEASRKNFMTYAPMAHINVFCGHGDYDPANALNSCLHLHSDKDPGVEFTDPLRAIDLLRSSRTERFDSCSLFVLASCWGGRLDPMVSWSSKEVVGLASTLFQRGVASMLGALWPATVGPTSRLLTGFFQRFLTGQPASSSLRDALLDLRRVDNLRWDHPFFWAPFYLMGDYKAWP